MAKRPPNQAPPAGPGIIASPVAVSLLMLESEAELMVLVKAGRFSPVAPGQWRVVDLVQGYIRHLRESGQTRTTGELAELCGLSVKWIQMLRNEGFIKPLAYNRWSLADVLGGVVRFYRDENRRSQKNVAQQRIHDARAREIEVRTAERERRLIDVDEALGAVDQFCGIVRTELAGLASRCSRELQMRRLIDQEVHGSLTRIAERIRKIDFATRSGRSLVDAIEDDDAGSMGEGEPDVSRVDGQAGAA